MGRTASRRTCPLLDLEAHDHIVDRAAVDAEAVGDRAAFLEAQVLVQGTRGDVVTENIEVEPLDRARRTRKFNGVLEQLPAEAQPTIRPLDRELELAAVQARAQL